MTCPSDQKAIQRSRASQRQRLLQALQSGSVSTIDARDNLHILHPAGRIRELRKAGHNITQEMIQQTSAGGYPQRVARYTLEVPHE